jgi:hypothetical protein
MEQSERLAASSKSARAAVQFCDRGATIAENMPAVHSGKKEFQADTQAFQPVAEEFEAIFEGSKRSPNSTISSRDKRVFSRDTRTIRNPRNLHGINHITLSKVGQNRMFSKCPTLVHPILKVSL